MARHPLVDVLIAARKQRGWSQTALARRLYRSQGAISYFETRTAAPPLAEVEQIARALGLRLALVPLGDAPSQISGGGVMERRQTSPQT